MYQKVSTDMNFVEREHVIEKFWKDNRIFEKSERERQGVPATRSMTGRPRPTASPTSVTWRPAPSRT